MIASQTVERRGTPAPTNYNAGAPVVAAAVANLHAWLQTMRGPHGYGGPVAHWWQQSLVYGGAGLDWRYEGIIAGYLELWRRTGDANWLAMARRAGEDLLAGHLPNGHFEASAFEINPASAGTPHEAACDVGLLLLAHALREQGDAAWQGFAACAARNMRLFYLMQLWDADARAFRDSPGVASFVPNKAATACEALFLLADLFGDDHLVTEYALPTLDRLLAHQVRGGQLDGAIAQNSFGERRIEKYFPIYIARCVPGLLRGHAWTGDERYLDAALRAVSFIARWRDDDGALPTVVYPNGRTSSGPAWVAPLGDVLRAVDALRPYGFAESFDATLHRLLGGQDASGGIQTATGFSAQAGGRAAALPDIRDVLHVVGWCDKAFRYLAAHVDAPLPAAISAPFEAVCSFRGQPMQFRETPELIEISRKSIVSYRWRKGDDWPGVAAVEFWLR